MYNRAKHIDTRIYRVRELSTGKDPEVDVYKIAGEYQPADIFTKPLERFTLCRHRDFIFNLTPHTTVKQGGREDKYSVRSKKTQHD